MHHRLDRLLGAFDAPEITLSPLERQVVLLAVSVENRCEYCTAAHGALAAAHGLGRSEVVGLQQDRPLADPWLETLRRFTQSVVRHRGRVSEPALGEFVEAGFSRAQALEVVLGVAVKTLTNYANHIAQPPVNEQFAAFLPAWKKAA